jgi:hypothetical protein
MDAPSFAVGPGQQQQQQQQANAAPTTTYQQQTAPPPQQQKQQQHPQPAPQPQRPKKKKKQANLEDRVLVTRTPDEETEDGRVRNTEAVRKIRDTWIYKQVRARQDEFTQYRQVRIS